MQTSKANRLESNSGEEIVELTSLANLTGFPVDYIKSELLLEDDKVSLSDLRATMVTYLETLNDES